MKILRINFTPILPNCYQSLRPLGEGEGFGEGARGAYLRLGRGPRGGGGSYSTQSLVSTVKLIEKAVVVNFHTEGAVTFPYPII